MTAGSHMALRSIFPTPENPERQCTPFLIDSAGLSARDSAGGNHQKWTCFVSPSLLAGETHQIVLEAQDGNDPNTIERLCYSLDALVLNLHCRASPIEGHSKAMPSSQISWNANASTCMKIIPGFRRTGNHLKCPVLGNAGIVLKSPEVL